MSANATDRREPLTPPKRARESAVYGFGTEICRALQGNGHAAFFVGGCVRDFFLEPDAVVEDIDVTTSASVDEILALFPKAGFVGKSFGVCLVRKGHKSFEVATFRKDGPYSDRRRPDSVTAGTLDDDARRRDFTMNALYFDPVKEVVVDPQGGRADIARRIVRCVGDPALRLREDALRILRLFRFSANFDLNIEPATRDAARAEQDGLRHLSRERILLEVSKVRQGKFPLFARRLFETVDGTSVFDALGQGWDEVTGEDLGGFFPPVLHRVAPFAALAFFVLRRLQGEEVVSRVAREAEAWPVARVDRDVALRVVKLSQLDRAFAGETFLSRLLLAGKILREEDVLSADELVSLIVLLGAQNGDGLVSATVVDALKVHAARRDLTESRTVAALIASLTGPNEGVPPEVAFAEAQGLQKSAISALLRLHEMQSFVASALPGVHSGRRMAEMTDLEFVHAPLSAFERLQERFRRWERGLD